MRQLAHRLLPVLALAVSLGGCGTFERKPGPTLEPTLAGSGAGNPPSAGDAGGSLAARPATAPIGAIADSSPGIRPGNPRLKLNLHVFGFSYHPDRKGTRDRHLDNELNLGLGLNYELHNDPRGVTSLETGFFKDSGRNWAKFAGAGYQFKFGDNWRLGADLLAIQSDTYNHGRAFVAPIPRLSYDFGRVSLSAVYVPRDREFNQFAVFGFYLTTPLGKW